MTCFWNVAGLTGGGEAGGGGVAGAGGVVVPNDGGASVDGGGVRPGLDGGVSPDGGTRPVVPVVVLAGVKVPMLAMAVPQAR